jgi:hypothetical protein
MVKQSKTGRERKRAARERRANKQRRQNQLVTVGIVAAVLVLMGGLVYAVAGPKMAWNVRSPDDVSRISPAKAKSLVDAGEALLVDTRSVGQYEALHAAGAISIPEEQAASRAGELPQDQDIVFYCT